MEESTLVPKTPKDQIKQYLAESIVEAADGDTVDEVESLED